MYLENKKVKHFDDFLNESSIEITLNFVSDLLDKNEISSILEIEPTFAWNANEIIKLGTSQKYKVTSTGKWSLKSLSKIKDLDSGLQSFFKLLPKDNKIWLSLTKKYNTYIEVTGYNSSWNTNYSISNKTLKLLTSKNISLNIDIYNMNIDETSF